MSDENNKPKKLSLSGSGKLSLGGTLDSSSLRSGDAGARRGGKAVQVEVRRKRVPGMASPRPAAPRPAAPTPAAPAPKDTPAAAAPADADALTAAERARRLEVLKREQSRAADKDEAAANMADAANDAANEAAREAAESAFEQAFEAANEVASAAYDAVHGEGAYCEQDPNCEVWTPDSE